MNIKDRYALSGTGFESFYEEVNSFIANTKAVKVVNHEITMLSFAYEENGYYYFDILNEKSVNGYAAKTVIRENASSERKIAFPILCIAPKDEYEREMLEETKKGSMLLVSINNLLLFVSTTAITSLCDRAAVQGEFLTVSSPLRNLCIAGGMFNPFKNNLKDNRSTLIVRRETFESGKTLNKVFAMTGSRHIFSSFNVLKEIAEEIEKSSFFGKAVLRRWNSKHTLISAEIEFPDMADRFQTEFGLPDRIVPGIVLIDSDMAKSSFTVLSTLRFEDNENSVVITKKTWEHVSTLKSEAINEYIQNVYPKDMLDAPKALAKQCQRDVQKKSLFTTYKTWMKELQMVAAIGKSRCVKLQNDFAANLAYMSKATEYDFAKLFMSYVDLDELSETAFKKCSIACGQAPFVNRKDVCMSWES